MDTKTIRTLLTPKGTYTKGDLENYSELSAGKIKAALMYKKPAYTFPLFSLIEDKDSSVGSECEKRINSLENKFFTHKAGEAFDASVEEIIKASVHARLFGLSVVELFLDEDGAFGFEFVPREYYFFKGDELYLKKGKTEFKPTEPKFYIITQKSVLLKTLWIVYAKHFVLSHYMKFAEFLGVPPLIGNAHSSDAEVIDGMAQAMKDIKSASYAVLGPEDILKVLEGRGSQADFMEFVRYADSEIAKVINGASLGSNTAKGGSYAQSKSHEENRFEITKGDVKFAHKTVKLLFSKIGIEAHLNIQIEKDTDLLQRAQTLSILNTMGYSMSAEEIATEFDLPAPSDTKVSAPKREANKKEVGLQSRPSLPLDIIDANLQSKEFNKRLKEQEEEILEIITNLAKSCSSYDEMYELLIKNYAALEFKKLDEMMFKAIANGVIVGGADDGK